MEIKKIVSEEMNQNCYLILEKNKGILIDPGLDTINILREIEGIEINYILLTHCHFDHIYSVRELRKARYVVGSRLCSENIMDERITLSMPHQLPGGPCDIIMNDGEEKVFDGVNIKCIYTPGHTNCSVCYLIENNLFSGDTLFYTSIGRCDMPTGNIEEIEDSIRNKLYKLNDEIVVYPGHGPSTTIGFEKKNNGYFTE